MKREDLERRAAIVQGFAIVARGQIAELAADLAQNAATMPEYDLRRFSGEIENLVRHINAQETAAVELRGAARGHGL